MKALMLTRRVDSADWLAGFAHGWIAALARHPQIDRLDVICLAKGTVALPDNVRVRSMGKELGYSRPRELWTFQRALAAFMPGTDVLFGHMIARYTLVALPWAWRTPIVQWYTHRHINREMRLIYPLVKRVVTASEQSFPYGSPEKVTVLGHGIDMTAFSPNGTEPEPDLIVSVGRLSPIKHHEDLIRAAAVLRDRGMPVRVQIAGGTTPQHGEAYAGSLRALIAEHHLEESVRLLGPVPHAEIADLVRRAAVTVNLCPTGGADKAVLESLACGVPAVVRNETFLPLLGPDASRLHTPDLDPAHIADRLAAVLSLPSPEHAALGARLREAVRADYALETLVDRLVGVFNEVRR